jgi:hypothetical protein
MSGDLKLFCGLLVSIVHNPSASSILDRAMQSY